MIELQPQEKQILFPKCDSFELENFDFSTLRELETLRESIELQHNEGLYVV